MRSFPLRGLLAAVPACLLLAGCDAQNAAAPTAGAIRPAQVTVGPVAERNFVYLCKDGTDASFNYSVGGVPSSISLVNGECQQIASHTGGRLAVNVTELIPANTVLDSITLSEIFGPTADPVGTTTNTTYTGTASVSTWVGLEWGAVITYYNRATPPPPPSAEGRMTGGGKTTLPGGISITNGFTIHCDIVLSNNLEINWPGNKWHIDKPLTSALCIDDPAIAPAPPKAPFDTFFGEGLGRLNGVDGSLVKFTFVDAGEPGKNDMIQLQIFDLNNNLVLDVPLTKISNGNFQAHYDQPHGNKP